jgi:hypothetical protein
MVAKVKTSDTDTNCGIVGRKKSAKRIYQRNKESYELKFIGSSAGELYVPHLLL